MRRMTQSSTLLVTGGAGFIGSHFIRLALSNQPNIQIINLDKLTYAASLDHLNDLPDNNRYQFVQGDIGDFELVSKLLNKYTIDTIVHFAAESHVDRSIHSPRAFLDTNIIGTYTLLEAARQYWQLNDDTKYYRFHHVSTDEVYGALQLQDPPFTENSALDPRSPYSASKASSDHLVKAYYHTYNLPVTLSHCSNNYGAHQHPEKFIPTVIQACMLGKPIPIYGKGQQIRDWLYVEDHCRGIMAILAQGQAGETYDMGGNNEWQNLDLAKYICELMDEFRPKYSPHANLLKFVTDRPGHDFRYAIDAKKIRNALRWHPSITMAEGMRKTIHYYLHWFEQMNTHTSQENQQIAG